MDTFGKKVRVSLKKGLASPLCMMLALREAVKEVDGKKDTRNDTARRTRTNQKMVISNVVEEGDRTTIS